MKRRQGNALAMLARARPARLDPDTPPKVSWSAVAQLIETAELTDDGPAHALDHGRSRPSVRRRPLVPVKLVGALTSAAVTAVVIVIAVIAGTAVFSTPHGQPTGAPSSPVSGRPPLARSLIFRSLPLGPHWHGHVAYAVSHGVVYLAGTATVDHQGSQSGAYGAVTTLPRLARPSGQLEVVAAVSTGSGTIEIGTDGQIGVIGPPASLTWVSLGGVSFLVGAR